MQDLSLASLVLPAVILDYFTISKVSQTEVEITILRFRIFLLEVKLFYLSIKRRRWINGSSGYIVNRNWEYVSKERR